MITRAKNVRGTRKGKLHTSICLFFAYILHKSAFFLKKKKAIPIPGATLSSATEL